MEVVARILLGVSKTNMISQDHVTVPRLVLEVNKSESVCIAANTPCFVVDGVLMADQLRAHIRSRMLSNKFAGFIMACFVENEDMVESLNLFPHVFSSRLFIYNPCNHILLEMCGLLSMLENIAAPSASSLSAIVERAEYLWTKNKCPDAAFLLHGIKTLASTSSYFYNINSPVESLVSPLLMFKLYKCIEEGDPVSKGLLKPIYLTSWKMDTHYEASNKDICGGCVFNLFYCNTVFTKHLQNKEVLKLFKCACVTYNHITNIVSQ
ncbi:orf 42 [Ateline gammaherpesvirus 3]|uniref:Orf 42 n=1 Tax=Ateline herpesvirus 3 TaxID=85618 RepID=Q9YTM3_ATHV3|nr:orf 42 [Ateline gammaherpesvirus 3]AAC95568.1 orf 42 [Ateline gammaherpesvirus 3]